MQMIDVLSRLAALDSANPTINNPLAAGQKVFVEGDQLPQLPALEDVSTLRALSGLKPVAECGPMGMMGGMEPHRPPASFSINATAADGDEVAGMLSQIMNLAGVHQVSADHMPGQDSAGGVLTSEPAMTSLPKSGPDIMRSALDAMNEPDEDEGMMPGLEDESTLDAAPPALPSPDMSSDKSSIGDEGGNETMQSMADEIRSMADRLKGIEDKDELNLETYDNTPADPTDVPLADTNALAWNPNAGGHGGAGLANNPRAFAEELENKLFAEYQQYVNEGKGTCCCEEKGKTKCPVHSKMKEALDTVGNEDDDVDNDGEKNTKSDQYLKNRRAKVSAAIGKK
jgi:hypothetical protein